MTPTAFRDLRHRLGLTQAQLAVKLGRSRAMIVWYEKGDRGPSSHGKPCAIPIGIEKHMEALDKLKARKRR